MKTKNFKSRHALLMSLTSLMLCVSMLFGATFAWFTDSVESGVNRIVSGNLDVELEYYDPSATATNEGWKDAADADAIFIDLANSTMLSRDTLWEPGHTEVAYLRLRNAGTLALNYQLSVYLASEQQGTNAAGDPFKLSDYLYYGITAPNAAQTVYTAAQRAQAQADAGTGHTVSKNDVQVEAALAPNTGWQYVTMIVYMPEETGNVANYKTGTAAPEIGLGVRLLATQQQAEADSFGTDYDAAGQGQYASRPVVSTTVSTNSSSTVTSLNVTVTTDEETLGTTYTGGGATITTSDGVASMTINQALAQKLAKTATASTEDSENVTSAQVVAVGRSEETNDSNVTVSYANVDLVDQNGDKIDLEALENEEDVTTSVYVGTGITSVITVKLNPGQLKEQVFVTGNNATYDSTTGKVTFAVKHFCPMEISYTDDTIYVKNLAELKAAVGALHDGDVIKFIANIVQDEVNTSSGQVGFKKAEDATGDVTATLDLNGYVFDGQWGNFLAPDGLTINIIGTEKTVANYYEHETGHHMVKATAVFQPESDSTTVLKSGLFQSTNIAAMAYGGTIINENAILECTTEGLALYACNDPKVTINGGELKTGENGELICVEAYGKNAGPEVTINNGKFDVSGSEGGCFIIEYTKGTDYSSYPYTVSDNYCKITVNGGVFTLSDGAAFLIKSGDGPAEWYESALEINGGTFYGVAQDELQPYVGEGHTISELNDGGLKVL